MRRILLLASACACILSSNASAAPQVVEATTPAASQQPAEIDAARIERAERAELNARMEAVLESANKTIEGLQKMIDASPGVQATQDLERRMAQAKQGLMIDLLRVQATFAREKGRLEQAAEIDAQIDAILHPKRPATAMPRNSDAARANAAGAR